MKSFLKLAVGLIITVGLLYIGIGMYDRSKRLAEIVESEQAETELHLSEYEVVQYDGYEINGSTAITYLKKVVERYEIPVTVITSSKKFTCEDSRYFDELRDIDSEYYINPLSTYEVTIERNKNDAISVVFIEYVK